MTLKKIQFCSSSNWIFEGRGKFSMRLTFQFTCRWIGAESLIGVSPGVGLNPKQLPELIDSSMIQFNKDSETDSEGPNGKVAGWGGWAERSNDYLASIKTGGKACSKDNPASDSEACEFKKTVLSNCNVDGAGFKEGQPCLFLKLNKIFGVENKHYDGTTEYEFDDGTKGTFPEDMPQSLKDHITSASGQ